MRTILFRWCMRYHADFCCHCREMPARRLQKNDGKIVQNEEQYINEILKQRWDKPSIYDVFTAYERRILKKILKLDNL